MRPACMIYAAPSFTSKSQPYGVLTGKGLMVRKVTGTTSFSVSLWLDHDGRLPAGTGLDVVLHRRPVRIGTFNRALIDQHENPRRKPAQRMRTSATFNTPTPGHQFAHGLGALHLTGWWQPIGPIAVRRARSQWGRCIPAVPECLPVSARGTGTRRGRKSHRVHGEPAATPDDS